MTAQTWDSIKQTCAIALTRQNGVDLTTYDDIFNTLFPQATSYAENRINREIPLLGNRLTVTAGSATTGGSPTVAWSLFTSAGATLSVPEQFYIVTLGVLVPYDRTSLDFIQRVWPNVNSTVAPSLSYQGGRYWATQGATNLYIAPTPDAAYSAQVTGLYAPAPISETNTATYLSTNYPELLEAGCLVFLTGAASRNFGAQADEPRVAVSWEAQFQGLLAAAKYEERRRRGMAPDAPMMPPPPQGAPAQ